MLAREAFQLQSSLWGSGLGPSLGATGKDPPAAASPACAQEPGGADTRGTDYHHRTEGHPETVTLSPSPGGGVKGPGTGAQSSTQAPPPAQAGLGRPSQGPWSPWGLPHDPRECVTCVPGQAAGVHLPATPITHRGQDMFAHTRVPTLPMIRHEGARGCPRGWQAWLAAGLQQANGWQRGRVSSSQPRNVSTCCQLEEH